MDGSSSLSNGDLLVALEAVCANLVRAKNDVPALDIAHEVCIPDQQTIDVYCL